MFIALLEEIQERVLGYCSIKDVKNLSLTNREYNESLRGYLFHTVEVPESAVFQSSVSENRVVEILPDRIRKLKETAVLRTYVHSSDHRIFIEAISELNQLQELHFLLIEHIHRDHKVPLNDEDLQILCDNLYNLRVLGLTSCWNITEYHRFWI